MVIAFFVKRSLWQVFRVELSQTKLDFTKFNPSLPSAVVFISQVLLRGQTSSYISYPLDPFVSSIRFMHGPKNFQ